MVARKLARPLCNATESETSRIRILHDSSRIHRPITITSLSFDDDLGVLSCIGWAARPCRLPCLLLTRKGNLQAAASDGMPETACRALSACEDRWTCVYAIVDRGKTALNGCIIHVYFCSRGRKGSILPTGIHDSCVP